MRILYFSRDYTPHDYRFLSSLAETDHQIWYLRLERKAPQREDRAIPEKIHIKNWNNLKEEFSYKNILSYVRELKKIVKEINPDVIHAGPVQSCAFLASLIGFRPLVTMSWGSDMLVDSQKSLFLKWITKYALNRSSLLLGDCKAVLEKAQEFGFQTGNYVQFPWGIDLNRFTPNKNELMRERRGWEKNFIILSLRSWEPIYGVDVLVKAFSLAAKEQPDLRLFLLGNGSQASIIRPLIEKAAISEKVFFGGQVSQLDLPNYYHASDLYISASHSDGSSVSLMEAMGCGLPTLVSDIPGNKEWINPGENGWLFKDGDIDDLKEKLIQIYDQRHDLQKIKLNARSQAEQKANWNENFKKLLFSYQLARKKVKG